MREACDQSRTHLVAGSGHDDRDRARSLFRRGDRWRADGNEDVWVECHQFGRKGRESLGSSLGVTNLEDSVSSLHHASFPEPLKEWRKPSRRGWGAAGENPDSPDLSCRLSFANEGRKTKADSEN